MKIGRYTVELETRAVEGRGFFGLAHVQWEDGAVTYQTTLHFGEPFATEEDAKRNALQQVELRVRDGVGLH